MDNLERLVAIEDIKNLKARYLYCVDGKRWSDFEKLFTTDCEFVGHDNGHFRMNNAKAFCKNAKAWLDGALSIHHVFAPEIEITGPATARGLWIMTDMLMWEKGAPVNGHKSIYGWGHYHEKYKKTSKGWRISYWELTRVKLDRNLWYVPSPQMPYLHNHVGKK